MSALLSMEAQPFVAAYSLRRPLNSNVNKMMNFRYLIFLFALLLLCGAAMPKKETT